ncbi:MAG TPA: ATP-binding protein [Gemmataceae bacterium]|nr:ATP-binding protein [Gemmataceae bacterium]
MSATAVLEYLRQLENGCATRTPGSMLEGLASSLEATEIGLGAADGSVAEVIYSTRPNVGAPTWRNNPDLLQRVRSAWSADLHSDDHQSWIVSMVGEPGAQARLAWACRAGKDAWTDADRTLWMVAAQAVARWLHRRNGDAAIVAQRLEQAAHVTGRLTHDFGNYLTGIMGFTELSLSQTALDSTLHRYLQEVLDSAKQGAAWIHRLHGFCRRGDATCWPTQLATVLAQEEARLRALGMLGIRWQTTLPRDLPLVGIETGALQAALSEIIANARDATKDQGTILITARERDIAIDGSADLLGGIRPGRHVELAITDDGPGMPADLRARLFREIFFSTKPRHRGLGLLVVYGIMQRYRGGVAIEPGPDGKGTCVKLCLPVATTTGPALSTQAPHVLLMHPDAMISGSMRELLEARGCRVSVASTPQAALTACRAKGSDIVLVITDLLMPQLAGLDLARKVLEHHPSMSFIFLLAQSSFHGLREEDLFKRFELLRWPMEPATLMRAIQTALARANRS